MHIVRKCTRINANALCVPVAHNIIEAFAFIRVYLRAFADKTTFAFKLHAHTGRHFTLHHTHHFLHATAFHFFHHLFHLQLLLH